VRLIDERVAIVHSRAGTILAGANKPSPSRDSMQLFVATKDRGGAWRAEAVLNARRLTLDQQYFSDAVESLSAEDRVELAAFVRSLHERRRAAEHG
jgi:hypothetical protein